MRVYRRGKVWWVDATVEGERHREPLKGATSKEAANRLAAARLLEFGGAPRETLTVGEAVQLYAARRDAKPARWGDELHRVMDFARHAGAKRWLSTLGQADVTAWVEALEARVGPATCRRYKTSLGSFFRWLVVRGHTQSSPTIGAYAPKDRSRKKVAPTPEEIAATLERVKGTRLEPAYMLAIYQGLRREEIVRADWSHVDLEARRIYVDGRKTPRAEATLPLHDDFRAWALTRERQGPIVARIDGGRYHAAALENMRREIGRDLINFHRARHGLATMIVKSGGSIEDVAALLRISPRTAYEHYAWLVPSARAVALHRFRLPSPSAGQ